MRLCRKLARKAITLLARAEDLAAPERQLRYPPVFIVGPPRSGTTLVYQAMCHGLAIAYPTNLLTRLRLERSPLLYRLLAAVARATAASGPSAFQSDHGLTPGFGGPHEAWQIWNEHFPNEPHYTPKGLLDEAQRRALYAAVAGIERAFHAPFVNKNVKHSVRIQALVEIFPRALFVEVVRDPLMTAQSIYLAQTTRPYSGPWYSVMPKGVDDLLDLDPIARSAAHVFWIQRDIAEDRERVGEERFLRVSYERFCAAPNEELATVARFMCEGGARTSLKRALPASFRCSHSQGVPDPVFEALRGNLATLYGSRYEPVYASSTTSNPEPVTEA